MVSRTDEVGGEIRTAVEAFEFKVAAVDRQDPYEPFSVVFDLDVSSREGTALAQTQSIVLDLDLDEIDLPPFVL